MKRGSDVAVSELMHRAQRAAARAVEMCELVELARRIKRVFDWIEEVQNHQPCDDRHTQQPNQSRPARHWCGDHWRLKQIWVRGEHDLLEGGLHFWFLENHECPDARADIQEAATVAAWDQHHDRRRNREAVGLQLHHAECADQTRHCQETTEDGCWETEKHFQSVLKFVGLL